MSFKVKEHVAEVANATVGLVVGLQEADIEDLRQDVALKLWQERQHIEQQDGEARQYAFQIARSELMDRLREKQREIPSARLEPAAYDDSWKGMF